jgi:mono/diheme cytochrome c family protein
MSKQTRSAEERVWQTVLLLALFSIVLGVTSFSRGAPQARGRVPAAPKAAPATQGSQESEKQQAARALYKRRCASCHGADGTGNDTRDTNPEIPNFTDRRWQERRTKAQLTVSVLDGRGKQMPSFRGKISDSQAQDLVEFVRAFGPKSAKARAISADEFETRWRQLQEELDQIKRQRQELTASKGKP